MSDIVVRLRNIAIEDRQIILPKSNEAVSRPYLGLEQIEAHTGRILKYETSAVEGKSTTFAFDTSHVLYGKLRPYLNKVAVPERSGRCSTEIIPLLPQGVDREFLAFLLRTERVVSAVMSEKTGSRMPRTDMDVLLNVEVVIPQSEVRQRSIAAQLKTQFAAVEQARLGAQAQARELEALESTFYRDAFLDMVPVGIPSISVVAPQNWRWAKLSDLARLESGHTPSRSRPDWWGGHISWVSLTEIRGLDGCWVEETEIKTNEEGIANSAARILPRETVCFSRTASVGFVTIMGQPMATSQDFANWVCGDHLDPEFLMYALIRSRNELRALATGATHKTIYMPTLEEFHICLPERKVQELIAKDLKTKLVSVEQARQATQMQFEEIELLPARLLDQAFEQH